MEDTELERYRRNVKKNIVFSSLIILIGLLIPPIAIFMDFVKPVNDTLAEWFQRSGSVVVILGLLSELNNNKISGVINATGLDLDGYVSVLQKEFRTHYTMVSRIGFVVSLLGSIVWGYGDVLYNEFFT